MGQIQLSNREIAILHMVAQGVDNKHIAEALVIEDSTVAVYVYRIRCKLGLPNREAIRALSSEQIEAYRRSNAPVLTPQQEQIIIFVVQGLTYKEIIRKMHSKTTVKAIQSHMQRIFKKLGIASRAQLVVYAIKAGLIQIDDIEL
jgi:DNA-binding NarL/FixJ family response regulator